MSPAPLLDFKQTRHNGRTIHFRVGHIILKVFSQDDSFASVRQVMDSVMGSHSFDIVGSLVDRWGYLRLADPDTDITDLAKALNEDDRVEYAHPDLQMKGSVEPSDPYLDPLSDPRQWGPEFINLYEVWETNWGDESTLIGLIDSGLALIDDDDVKNATSHHDRLTDAMGHEDFDGSRFIAGYNYIDSTSENWPHDDAGDSHGTSMAGIIAAQENNLDGPIGIAGVNWGSPVYVAKALDANDFSTVGLVFLATSDILNFAAASDNLNVVINLSINYADEVEDDEVLNSTMHDMFKIIVAADAVICISAGNKDMDPETHPIEHPAYLGVVTEEYTSNVIAVGAISEDWKIFSLSGRGVAGMVFAPGVDIATTVPDNAYKERGGTSHANAHVSGLAALLWGVDPDIRASEIVGCIKKNCQFPTLEMVADGAASAEELSLGVVDAYAALESLRGSAELLTPSIIFDDVTPGLDHEEEIQIEVKSCREATFTVSTSGHDFGIASSSYSHDSCSGSPFLLVATYSASAGDSESGIIKITWDQNPSYRWEIGISGSKLVRPKSIILVLDKSGSMGADSGVGSYTRMEVLKYSAGILVDLIETDDGIGLVKFDSIADTLAAYTPIPLVNPDPIRASLKAAIDTPAPGGMTSIAAGILEARKMLDTLPELNTKAIIVLTDGRETHEPWLEEVMAEEIPFPLYAIGIGTPSTLDPAILDMVAGMTDGYCILTGDLDESMAFEVAELLSQILMDLDETAVAYDPTQYIRPGAVHRFPVILGEADKRVQVLLMRPPGAPLEYKVIDPSGRILPSSKIQETQSDRLVQFDFDGPLRHRRPGFTANGVWNVEVMVPEGDFSGWIKGLKNRGVDTRRLELHGAAYSVRVHSRSNIRMKCRPSQTGYSPGSTLYLNVDLTERGRPLRSQPKVTAELTDPHGRKQVLSLVNRTAHSYEISITAQTAGIYRWKIKAEGRSRIGHAFRRECRLTGAVWNSETTGMLPPLPVFPGTVPHT